jgi:3-deoxy-D-manno-octulosonate 8-phosphate phosphatase (KDO 8-P phosphatase)
VLDVDGVLTDGSIIYAGGELDVKVFHVQDGFGITLAKKAGLLMGVLTGRVAAAVERRVKELKFDYYECGHFHKHNALQNMIRSAGVDKSEVLYMGDDILDLPCISGVGVFVAPDNAMNRVKQEATWVTSKQGGDGAVREMINALLDAQGLLQSTEEFFIGRKQ